MTAQPARLDRLLEDAAHADPQHPALIDPIRRQTLTYGELFDRASRNARVLVEAGVRSGDRVGLVLDKSFESVAWIYGILAAGAAYVPVDPHAPADRIAFVLADCGVRGVVRDEGAGATWLPLSHAGPTPDAGPRGTSDESSLPAYILYTSGSTGRPKGVVHTHHSALRFLDAFSTILGPSAADCFSCHPPYHFDMSTLDLFLSVKHRSRAVLITQDAGRVAPALAQVISENGITIWWSVPTALRLLLQFGRLQRHKSWSLRHVMFAGEPLSPADARRLQEHWPDARLYNVYGCTETNNSTIFELPAPVPAERTDPFPIGQPVPNVTAAVVDADLRDVPAGAEGELLVAGDCLMSGYWGDTARTAAALVERGGTRWYRTGDVVRQDPSGNYVMLGRSDRMVKRRGYRIELAEIELCLARHPDVLEVAVVANKQSEVTIHAFVAARNPGLGMRELTEHMLQQLPNYMVPDTFTTLDEIPKTSTGKTDYQRLLKQCPQ